MTRKGIFWRSFSIKRPGYFRETENEQVMAKVDELGNILGFSVLHISAMKDKPLEVAL